jgi:hypothetical protein
LGHRESIDFNFFSYRSFRPLDLVRSIGYLQDQTITQQGDSTLSCDVETEKGIVKMSFFGGLSLAQIEPPERVESNGVAVASLRDIFGMKCATVPQRNETKDYLDIHALLGKTKMSLTEGIAAAKAIYGRQYSPVMTLQALSYFDDLIEPLTEGVRADLRVAVRTVSLQHLSSVSTSGKIGESVG